MLSSAAQQKRIGELKVIAARTEVDAARLMWQAADILASPAAMQIRQLEVLQAMAKSTSSKVVSVLIALQSDVIGQVANQGGASGLGVNVIQEESGERVSGTASRTGVLSSVEHI